MQLTEEKRKALLDEIDYNRKNCFLSDKTELLMQIAEAALTARPVGYTVITGAGNTLFRKNKPRKRVTNEAAIPVYTAPPVTALSIPGRDDFERVVSQNGKWQEAVERSGDGYKLMSTQSSWLDWQECIAEVKRLSATAPQPDSSMNLGSFDPRPDFTPRFRIKTCYNNDGYQVEE